MSLTLSDVEEIVQKKAGEYCAKQYGMRKDAVRVILWPTNKYISVVQRGPSAVLRMGIIPGHPDFNKTLTRQLDFIAEHKLYNRMELQRTADFLRINENIRSRLREEYNFDEEMIPLGIKASDMSIKTVQRVEAVHRPSGIREVVEFEQGKGNIWSATELVKARLARRVAETLIDPTTLPSDHPDWVARTN